MQLSLYNLPSLFGANGRAFYVVEIPVLSFSAVFTPHVCVIFPFDLRPADRGYQVHRMARFKL